MKPHKINPEELAAYKVEIPYASAACERGRKRLMIYVGGTHAHYHVTVDGVSQVITTDPHAAAEAYNDLG